MYFQLSPNLQQLTPDSRDSPRCFLRPTISRPKVCRILKPILVNIALCGHCPDVPDPRIPRTLGCKRNTYSVIRNSGVVFSFIASLVMGLFSKLLPLFTTLRERVIRCLHWIKVRQFVKWNWKFRSSQLLWEAPMRKRGKQETSQVYLADK